MGDADDDLGPDTATGVAALAAQHHDVTTCLIPGADHQFSGHETTMSATVAATLRRWSE
jgi:alpha/beta superfamily hydrolase